jgi:hypothetical protein
MKRRLVFGFVSMALVAALIFPACGKAKKEGSEEAVQTTPIDQLIQAGKAPVEVSGLSRGISPLAPTFSLSVTNVSNCPVSLLNGTVIFFDKDGAVLPDTKAETGYGDLSPIEPGAKVDLSIITQNESAVTGQWIIKEVVYEKPNPMGESWTALRMKWTNPKFEVELAEAEARQAKDRI